MTKLTILTACLLVVSSLAMPVTENERKEQQAAPASVVPLEKSRSTAPVLLSGEPVVPSEVRAIEPEKKVAEEASPKKLDDTKKEEEKKPEIAAKKAEEEKKPVEEPKKLEEEVAKPTEQAVVERKLEDLAKDLPKEAPAAPAVELPGAAVTAEVAPIEPKIMDEQPLAVEKKSSESPAKELAKQADEMRVTREAEEAAKKVEEDKTVAAADAAAKLALKTATEAVVEAKQVKEEEKPKIEATIAAEETKKQVEDIEKKVEVIEAKSVEPLAPAEPEVVVSKEQRSEDGPATTGVAVEEQQPAVATRSEDAAAPLAKEAAPSAPSTAAAEATAPVLDSETAAIPAEEQKIVPAAAIEKSAKLTDEVKAEELPKPEEVKDAKVGAAATIATAVAEPSATMAEKKEESMVAEKKLVEEKKEEKKEMNSSEEKEENSSSEEKKVEDKKKDEDKKDESSEEKDSSEELKKDEMKKETVVAPITAESQAEPKAPAS